VRSRQPASDWNELLNLAFGNMTNDLRFRLRRGFAFAASLMIAGHALPDAGQVETVKIRVDPGAVVSRISPDFIGLGYETSAVAQSNFFSVKNTRMVHLYRNLSRRGMVRIGGNISDHTKYVPDGAATVHSEKEVTIINQANLAELAGFARATGWKVMWGLNMGTSSKEEAAQEALAVRAALDGHLHSFEIGNEVDLHNGYDVKYHGMLAFVMAGKGDLLKLDLDKGAINLAAYATKPGRGLLWITVVNKDLSRDAELEAILPKGYHTATAFRLGAPSVQSKDRVTFAGAEVAADGTWSSGPAERVLMKEGVARLPVPHASAVLVRLQD